MSNEKLTQRIAAKAVIIADGGVLVLHPSAIDANRKWHIPGGIRDDISEPIGTTATREVLEETGINLDGVDSDVFKVGEWRAMDKGEQVKILAVFFLYKLAVRPEVVLSDEHIDSAWIDANNHLDYDANTEVHEIVELLFGNNA